MAEHYNLYYLLLEEREKNPMPEQKAMAIQKNLEKFFKNIKPKANLFPLTIRKAEKDLLN